jgi:hypothetical protein
LLVTKKPLGNRAVGQADVHAVPLVAHDHALELLAATGLVQQVRDPDPRADPPTGLAGLLSEELMTFALPWTG